MEEFQTGLDKYLLRKVSEYITKSKTSPLNHWYLNITHKIRALFQLQYLESVTYWLYVLPFKPLANMSFFVMPTHFVENLFTRRISNLLQEHQKDTTSISKRLCEMR